MVALRSPSIIQTANREKSLEKTNWILTHLSAEVTHIISAQTPQSRTSPWPIQLQKRCWEVQSSSRLWALTDSPKMRKQKANYESLWTVIVFVCGGGGAHLCPTLCDPMDYSPPGSSVHGILQARKLEWIASPFSRGSSRPRDQTHISCVSCIAGRFFNT